MTGSAVPPTPDHGGGEGGHFRKDAEEGRIRLRKKLLEDDEDLIIIISSWMASKNDN